MANNTKRTLYVGGLADNVDRNMVKSAFLPFGDVIDVNLPMDYSAQKHKGFAFVEFQMPEDAADAIDNMDNGEILGKTIRVNFAKPMKFKNSNNQPIWADDDYLRKIAGEQEDGADKEEDEEEINPELANEDENNKTEVQEVA